MIGRCGCGNATDIFGQIRAKKDKGKDLIASSGDPGLRWRKVNGYWKVLPGLRFASLLVSGKKTGSMPFRFKEL